jgi:hypothetical protein
VHFLTLLSGLTVIPLQMTKEDAVIEACLRDFGTAVDFDEFMNGSARPSGSLLLYKGHRQADPPVLYEASAELTEHLKGYARVQ